VPSNSADRTQCSFWGPSDARADRGQSYGLIAARAISAASTDGADSTDATFRVRAYPDHSGPQPAFTRERDLDTQRPQERLRAPQAPGECLGCLAMLGCARRHRTQA
jgi:hypothetical protein